MQIGENKILHYILKLGYHEDGFKVKLTLWFPSMVHTNQQHCEQHNVSQFERRKNTLIISYLYIKNHNLL